MPDTTRQAQPETVALFISDIHLHPSRPRTAQAFFDFLQIEARRASRLYMLGDIFEHWAGDDDLALDFHQTIAAALRSLGDAGVEVFWIGGNRDFLLGEGFAQASGAVEIEDPHVADIGGLRVVLTHGDAYCLDDSDYQAFRRQVRDPNWQRQFLAMPLEQRKAMIEGFRSESREASRMKSAEIMDVSPDAIAELLERGRASVIIHGHTHRPGRHVHAVRDEACERYVLPDWEYDDRDWRGGWVAIRADGSIACFDAVGQEFGGD